MYVVEMRCFFADRKKIEPAIARGDQEEEEARKVIGRLYGVACLEMNSLYFS